MRIVFITPPPDRTGGQRVVATYADRLSKRGHQVLIVAPPRPKPKIPQIIRSLLRQRQWPVSKTILSHYDDHKINYQLLDRFRPVTNDDVPDADVVIATWWETAEWMMKLSPIKGTKVYFIQHHEVFDFLPVERTRATYRQPLHKIVVAPWLADVLRNEYGDPKAHIVRNAVDLELFRAETRDKNRIPTVGFMYSTHPSKGTDIILCAIKLAQKQIPDLRVIAFDPGRPAKHLPLPDGAEYHQNPPQSEICKIYEKCDAWLFGSRSEGFGLPILEAMACRTPVIGTPAGAAPELLASGGGYLVKPENPDEMAAAIVQICKSHESEWRKMSDAAYATASRYSWDDATELFEASLQSALTNARAPLD